MLLLLLLVEAKLMMHGGRVMPCQMAGSKQTEALLLLLLVEAKLMLHRGRGHAMIDGGLKADRGFAAAAYSKRPS